MQTEHHFVVKYVSGMGWMWDIATEEVRFPEGTVWNGWEWIVSDSSAEVVKLDRDLSYQLGRSMDAMNGDI